MQVTSSHIKQVKRVAKELKDTYPWLKLGQRQDKAAVQELGVRNYHEAIRLHDKWIMLHVHVSPDPHGVSKCSLCDYSFAFDLKEDRESHREVHEQFHEASEAMGYCPANFVLREQMKDQGSKQAFSDQGLEARIEGVLLLLRGWYDRSLAHAIYGNYWRKHPSFEAYVSMIPDTLGGMYQEQKAELRIRYGYCPGHICPGDSNWYPRPH